MIMRKRDHFPYDRGFLGRIFKPLIESEPVKEPHNCRTDGHSFSILVGENIICALCGQTKAQVEARIEAGEYEYDAIKSLDKTTRKQLSQ
jgi:hypothetical protein